MPIIGKYFILNNKAVISSITMEEPVDYFPGLKTALSKELYERAKNIIPGGASSHCRCYPTFDPYPIALQRGKGSRVWDLDGNEYIDYCLALGPLILGHSPPSVIRAVADQLEKGTMFASLVEQEPKLAEKFREMVPNAEMVRFSNTGAEATMHAIRIARAYTGRDKIIKFEGHYHGAHDYVLVNCFGAPLGALGSEAAPYKVPSSWGIPSDTLKTVIPLPWNDLNILERTLRKYDGEIAAVISEPVMMNIGSVPPEDGYLQGMRELTKEHDVVFILDEIITGFRLAPGGAQQYFDIKSDIATFGKALGAGFPISAIAGTRKIMEYAVPGKVLHAGTYNSNPVCLAAAYASLSELSSNNGAAYNHLNKIGKMLYDGLVQAVERAGCRAIVQGIGGGGLQLYFTNLKRIGNFRDFYACDFAKYLLFHKLMLKRGVYFHPGQNEHLFVSTAHSEADIDRTISAATDSLREMARQGH